MAEVSYTPGQTSTSAPTSEQNPEPWKLLGRDTAAGKILFRLYGSDYSGKGAGNQFHQQNKLKHDKKLSSGWSPPTVQDPPKPVVQRPSVNYPKFGKSHQTKEPAVAAIPRRRPAAQILKELDEEKERQRLQPQQPAPGRLLDEREKERCAMMMHYRGKPPTVTVEELAHVRCARKQKTEMDELQEMFQEVMQEIEERKAFLADMEKHGALKRDMAHQLRNEIRIRVQDMEQLDHMISELDGR